MDRQKTDRSERIVYGLDLFSGIGGITKALEGYVRPVAYCENDRYAQAVLLSRMHSGDLPKAPIWDDVRTLRGEMLDEVDIIYGGFPCQDISVAGRGAGLAGERSGLFFEIARLVSEIRPRFVFLENVSAITVRGAERVVGEFCRLRYDCRWGILSASDVGANHQRERWWLLAHATSDVGSKRSQLGVNGRENKAEQIRVGCQESDVAHARLLGPQKREIETAGIEQSGKKIPDPSGEGLERWTQPKAKWTPLGFTSNGDKQTGWWESEPNVGRVAHGIPFRTHRLKGLGNAVVPAQAREAFERLLGIKK